MPVILGMQEAEIRGTTVANSSKQFVRPYLKKTIYRKLFVE
jgi:hypothetical protein